MSTMTAAERRAKAREAYDAYIAECPSRQLLDTLSSKWVTLVVVALADGPQRYSERSRTIAGVSQKMLTQTLRALERDGLVKRTITPAVPVRVDAGAFDLVVHPFAAFVRNYVLRGEIRDGLPGFIVSIMNAYYVFLKFARLWELDRRVVDR